MSGGSTLTATQRRVSTVSTMICTRSRALQPQLILLLAEDSLDLPPQVLVEDSLGHPHLVLVLAEDSLGLPHLVLVLGAQSLDLPHQEEGGPEEVEARPTPPRPAAGILE